MGWRFVLFFFSSRRRHTRLVSDWSSDVCSSDLAIVPGLMARLRDRAPGASLRVVPSHVGVAEALQTGRVDLGTGSFAHIPDRFASEDLFQETLVWVLSADHPAAREPMTLERLAELPHLIIALTGEDPRAVDGVVSDHGLEWRLIRDDAGAFQGALSSRGLRRRIGLTVPHVLAAPRIVARTDMAALIPRRLAVANAERYRLRLFDPPYPSPPHAVTAVWDGAMASKSADCVVPPAAARGGTGGRERQPAQPVHRPRSGLGRGRQLLVATRAGLRYAGPR